MTSLVSYVTHRLRLLHMRAEMLTAVAACVSGSLSLPSHQQLQQQQLSIIPSPRPDTRRIFCHHQQQQQPLSPLLCWRRFRPIYRTGVSSIIIVCQRLLVTTFVVNVKQPVLALARHVCDVGDGDNDIVKTTWQWQWPTSYGDRLSTCRQRLLNCQSMYGVARWTRTILES